MEPVECRAVMRFIYLRGHSPKEMFNEINETYGEVAPSLSSTDIVCSRVVEPDRKGSNISRNCFYSWATTVCY
jgi:hypothetical protein